MSESVSAKARIAVTATFTAEPLQEPLEFWLQVLGISGEVEFSAYSQVFQQLLDPSSLLGANRRGLNVVLVRLEDWWRDVGEMQPGPQEQAMRLAKLERHPDELLAALQSAAARSAVPYLLCLCPISQWAKTDPVLADMLLRVQGKIVQGLAAAGGIYVVTPEQASALYPVFHYEDRQADDLGHVPYTREWFQSMASMIARRFYRLQAPPYKVLALDCDETLWRGICGEEGPLGVQVDAKCRALQEFALAQREAGVVLCLCSKNNEEDVWKVFDQNPGMVLKREHIVGVRINWQPKSENLRALSRELQLGLDSFIFLDDSRLECSEVEARCPEVLALCVPESEGELSHLAAHVWAFDHLKVTAEDRKRSELYAQEVRREQLRQQSVTLDDFLAGLELNIDIAAMEKADVARVAQLTQRTNQFNFTTLRCSESEVEAQRQSGPGQWMTIRVKDRFGDYGLVGAILYTPSAKSLEAENVLLSCRALGRRVEHQMLTRLDAIAQEQGLDYVRIRFVPSAKNKPAREFLEGLGSKFDSRDASSYSLAFPAGRLTELCAQAQTNAAETAEPEAAAAPSAPSKANVQVLRRIALELDDPGKISRAIDAKNPLRQRGDEQYASPRTPLEETLAQLWAQTLKMDKVGLHDNFFALGGHSLLAMRIVAEIRDRLNVDFSLEEFFQAPVLQAQSNRIEEMLLVEASAGDLDRLLAEMESENETQDKPKAASAVSKNDFRGIA